MIEFLAAERAPRAGLRHLGETALLLALFGLWALARPFPLAEPLGFGALLFGALLLSRILPSPARFHAATFCWLFVIPATLYARRIAYHRTIFDIPTTPHSLQPANQVWVPYLALGGRDFLALALPFLLGASAAQPKFSLPRFVSGYMMGALALCAAFYGPLFIRDIELSDGFAPLYHILADRTAAHFYGSAAGLWGGVLFGLLFSIAAISLPEVRRALESALAINLAPSEAPHPKPEGFLPAALAHANLILLLLAVGGFTYYGHYERKMIEGLQGGTALWPETPTGAVNALDVLRPILSEDDAPQLSVEAAADGKFKSRRSRILHIIRLPLPFDIRMLANWKSSAKTADAAVGMIDRDAFARLTAELDPAFRAVDLLREADGSWRWSQGKSYRPKNGNLLTHGRLLGVHGIVAVVDGRDEDALRDIERLVNLGWAAQDRAPLMGSLVGQMLRSCALNVAYNLYLHRRSDPEALAKLEALLIRLRPRARLMIDPKMPERSGPGFWPVVPAYDLTMPAISRRREQILGAAAEYDRLVIALALERFRRDHGAYPSSLSELAPAYLDPEPRDPIHDLPYIYQPRDDGFVLDYKDLAVTRKASLRAPGPPPTYQEDCANPSLEGEIKAAQSSGVATGGASQP